MNIIFLCLTHKLGVYPTHLLVLLAFMLCFFIFGQILIMVTTCADHGNNTLAELEASAKEYHHPPSPDDDGKNHGLSFEDVKKCVTEQALQQCHNPTGAWAKEWVEINLNPPPLFESDNNGIDEDHNSKDEAVYHTPRSHETEYTPPNTDQTLPVPTAVKPIMEDKMYSQQLKFPKSNMGPRAHTFLAEFDKELSKKKS